MGKQFAGIFTPLAGFCESDFRIGAEGEQQLLPSAGIVEVPKLPASFLYKQNQPESIRQFVVFIFGLRVFNLYVSQRNYTLRHKSPHFLWYPKVLMVLWVKKYHKKHRMSINGVGPVRTIKRKKPLIYQGLLDRIGRCWIVHWRRERDSNPRYAINIHTLSRRAPSTARTSLRKREA